MNHLDDERTPEGLALRAVMERGMAGVRADVDQLERLATHRGRRLRNRRRTGRAACAAAAAVVAVVAASQLGPGVGGGARGVDAAVAPGEASTATRAPTDWWNVPANQMVGRLEALLPTGVTVVTAEPDIGHVAATLAGPDGRGDLQLILSGPAPAGEPDGYRSLEKDGKRYVILGSGPDVQQQISCPGDLGRTDECTEITDAEGRHVGRTSATSMGRVLVHEAVVVGPAGGTVYAASTNATDQRWAADSTIDGPEPPLSLAELLAVVEDPSWTS